MYAIHFVLIIFLINLVSLVEGFIMLTNALLFFFSPLLALNALVCSSLQ